MTREELNQVFALIAEEHSIDFTEGRRLLWLEALKNFPVEAVQGATMRLLAESPYPPKLAHLMERLRPAALVAEEADADALLAWRLCREGPIADPYKTFLMQDKVAALALDAVGGARLLSQMPEDELERFTRPQFCRAYRSFAVAQRAHPTGKMVGILEQENAARFLLGDEDLRRLTAPTRTLPPTEPPAPPRPLPPPERPDVPPGKGSGPLKSALDALKYLRDRGKKPQTEGEGA